MSDYEEETPEEQLFDTEAVKEAVTTTVSSVLSDCTFVKHKVDGWTSTIIEQILKKLAEFKGKLYKYVVTCIIMEKSGAGLYTSYQARWENDTDTHFTDTWTNDHLICITTVYGVAV